MKKLFSVLLAAVLAAGTMVLPTAAADGDIVYLQTFDNVASYDDLGWEIVETLTTNTSTYTIENGALTVDNLGGNDSYTVVVPASVMDEVNKGDYTVGYDFTLLESGDTARYLAMLLNYDREVGNTYNSLHMRMKGYADWQNRFVGTWSSNMDLSGGYQGLPVFTSKDDGAISNRLFGLAFNDGANVIAGKTIRYEMRVSNSGGYAEVYMNGVLISGTDEAGWDQFTWASEDYSEICLKSGGSILGTVDNVVVAKGLGIPEGTLPAMEGAAASSTGLPATEYDSIANYAGIKPVIDGKIDAIWDATAAQESTYPGDRDGEGISGYTKILWDEDGIYYLGVVNDPTTLMEANPAGTDSIDFWVSETYSDEMGYPLAGDYQISLSPYNTLGGYYIGNEKAPESVKEHAAVINGDGTYVLEIAMPWMDPDFKPAAGAVIGYNASFNNDIDGDAARDSWTSWVEWNGMPYWSDSMWLGQVELVKADVAVAVDEAPAADAPAAEAPAAAGLPAAYPASGTAIPDGSVLIAGELIGSENGWDGTAASGRASAFDGNIETFFDPATASVDYCGIDAGEEMILTKIIIHPRTTFLDRFNGATIEASNDPEFEESVELFFSVEQAAEIAFVDCTSEMEESENTGYRYFRYINYMSHGDVAEVELYGKAKDGTNPTYGAAEAPAASAPAAAAPAGGAEPTILWDFNSDEALNDVMSGANAVSYFGDTIDGVECYEFLASGNDPYVSINIPADNVEDVVWAKARVKNPSYSTAIELFGATNGRSLAGSECTHIELKSEDDGWYTYIIYIPEENVKTVNAYKDPQYAITEPYWAGTVEFIRLDPLWREGDDGSDAGGNMEGGESVYIDYIAFFPTKEDALAFRPELDNYAFPEQGPAAAEAPAAEAAPAAAAEFVTYTEYPEMTGTELVYATGDMDMLSGYDAKGGIGVDLFNLASGGTSYCLKRDTSAWYDFEVAEKTDVTFYVGYIARDGSNRGLDYAVDGGARIFMDLAESAEQQWVSATFTVDAGKHSFYLYAPTGMDDSTLKSCDIYTIELYGTPAAAEEPAPAPVVEEAPAVEEVPAEEPAAEEAPAEEVVEEAVEEPAEEIVEEEVVEEAPAAAAVVEEAPQTFDFGVIAAISALVSLAGFSLTKKR